MNIFEELKPGLSGLEQLLALIASGHRPPMAETLEFDLVEARDGYAVFAGTPGQRAYNFLDIVHGGYAATLLDSACGCAIHSKLSAVQAFATLELIDRLPPSLDARHRSRPRRGPDYLVRSARRLRRGQTRRRKGPPVRLRERHRSRLRARCKLGSGPQMRGPALLQPPEGPQRQDASATPHTDVAASAR
jgi:acyl-coenzyme A thioesterase PaaI-like protein